MSAEQENNNIDDQFKKFLADNKIDISALQGTKDQDRLLSEAKDQRTMGIIKQVSKQKRKNQIKLYIKHYCSKRD